MRLRIFRSWIDPTDAKFIAFTVVTCHPVEEVMTQTASDAQESQAIFGKNSNLSADNSQVFNDSSVDIPSHDDHEPRTNGHGGENGENEEHPSKRRRVSESLPKPRPKPESPPWKKAVAEGPSSFTQDGIRKSGRTNQIPLELQPQSDRRQTRGALQKTYSAKSKYGALNGSKTPLQTRDASGTPINGVKKSATSGQSGTQQPSKSLPKSTTPPKRSRRKSTPNDQIATPVRPNKRSSTPKHPQSAPVQSRPGQERRSMRAAESTHDEEAGLSKPPGVESGAGESPKARPTRIKFRVKPATLPITHPGLILPRPKQYSTLQEYLDSAADISCEAGGLLGPEDGPKYTVEGTIKDAHTILRLEEAAEPSGILSYGTCSVYKPEKQDRLPEQYAHQDHLNRAVKEFRRLILIEHNKHRATAKRLAEACRDEWYRRQPKTSAQLEAEQIKATEARYKALVRSLQATWENVRTEVNRRRLLEWEAQIGRASCRERV